ncbi:MAG: hypothetical protein E7266_06595 [Lachnospiraceae bacterium]|nr:hypothetical protein [Lachnospiraceae bacterium]
MKAADYVICFGIVLMSFLVIWQYRGHILVSNTMANKEMNVMMDEIVRDSLEKTIIDMNEIYDEPDYIEKLPDYKEKLIENIFKEMEFVFMGTSNGVGKRIVQTGIEKVFLLWGNVFIIYDDSGFREYEVQGGNEKERYMWVVNLMEKECGHSLNLPLNDYETGNKIGEYSLSVMYMTSYDSRMGSEYGVRCFSSAKVFI